MKKYHFIIILLLSFVLLGSIQPVYSGTKARLEELSSQQARIEQMKTAVNSFFVLAKDSDQRKTIESALNKLIAKIDSIEKRVRNKIKELELESISEVEKTRIEINNFLDDPTIENLKDLCRDSKDLITPETTEGLSDDRTKITKINKSLYDNSSFRGYCNTVLTDWARVPFIFTQPRDSHKIDYSDSDTDRRRLWKIHYNDEVEKYIGVSELYGFPTNRDVGINEKNPAVHFEKFLMGDYFPYNTLNPGDNRASRHADFFSSWEDIVSGVKRVKNSIYKTK